MRYVFGPFALDQESRELTRDGRRIPLTPRALELLRTLVRWRPRALEKAALSRTLWPDSFVSEGSLTQLVSELRKALGDQRRSPAYLRTVFGYGYAFSGEAREEAARAPAAFSVLWQGRELPLALGENLIGRDPQALVRLASPLASRRHAVIRVAAEQAHIEDLGSKNGTYLEGRRVAGEASLSPGDHVAIGEEVIVFCAAGAPGTTRSDPRRGARGYFRPSTR